MLPDPAARVEYVDAFRKLAARIADTLHNVAAADLPIKMFVAGGAALHFFTGERVSRDIDAVFSHRIALPEDLEISYSDADGAARLLYFDRQYNDTLALMHEEAHADSVARSARSCGQQDQPIFRTRSNRYCEFGAASSHRIERVASAGNRGC